MTDLTSSYVVIYKLNKDIKIKIGALGFIPFKKGYYAYAGSFPAKSLQRRIERHKRKSKTLRWHIDYFSVNPSAIFLGSRVFPIKECNLAKNLSRKFSSVDKFGASDCSCRSHFFYCRTQRIFKEKLF